MEAPPLRSIRDRVPAALVALAAGFAAVAGSYAAAGFTPAYVVAPVETVLARQIPGAFITFAIVVLGDLGQKLSLITATALSAGILGVLAGLGRAVADEAGLSPLAGPAAGVPVWGVTTVLTGRPVFSLGAGLAAALVVSLANIAGRLGTDAGTSSERRRVVGSLATLAGVGVVGWLLGNRGAATTTPPSPPTPADAATGGSGGSGGTGGGSQSSGDGTGGDGDDPSATEQALTEAEAKSLDVDGLEPLVSNRFYTVDISSIDPQLKATEWELSVTGAVSEEASFDYRDIVSRDPVREFSTLRCVGERLNGKKTDNALWTGVRVGDLLEEAGVPDRCCVMARGADSFFEEFPVDALRDALLVYRMNGEPLPRAHGYPARLVVPGHWGEIHVKWVTELEILDEPAKGYWEKKGWHGTGPVNTVAKLYVLEDTDDGRKQAAGHAYAGTRGISKVEVSTDGGSTWSEAELSEPLPGRAVWRQWQYTYDPPDGSHEIVVRATDGDGTLQAKEGSGPYPSGASGWVSHRVE
jgi:DMSO/TMAO reductase YedYZ molybdopterin-dependent catalytic subunit